MSSPAYGGGDIRRFPNPLVSTMNSRIPSSLTSRNIEVIGAGAAGLVAARELRREGHKTVVFERIYTSLFEQISLENLWVSEITHKEVLHYLKDFANDFKLIELIRFETEVFHVGLLKDDDKDGEKWVVRSAQNMRGGGGEAVDEVFDGVVVCNGHCTEPNIAESPGINEWPGKQMHRHNYHVPEPFRDQVVLVIGMSASGQDISRDMAVAKEVHVAGRPFSH
ncbi:hypothetical protein C5167_028508 [Papaver somniferum]|nr:hypothetical protein C5167_028508 [Papaver somniferum]